MGNVMAELFKLQEPTKFSDMPEIDPIVRQHYTYSILTINNNKKQKDRSRLLNDISLWAQ